MALFVPLDASYAHDPKVLDLGDERAELLFVRSLAYCKLHLTDGLIHRRALRQFAPFQDDVDPGELAAELVRVGLWREDDRGWVVVAWLKRNPSSEEVLSPSRGRELAHQRHHVKKGVQKEGCPFCFPAEPQVVAHDAVRDADHALPEPEPYPETKASASIGSTTSVVGTCGAHDASVLGFAAPKPAAALAESRAQLRSVVGDGTHADRSGPVDVVVDAAPVAAAGEAS